MPAQRCPQCGTINEPTAQQCDCGYNFLHGEMGRPRNLPQRIAPPTATEAYQLSRAKLTLIRIVLIATAVIATGGIRACMH